MASQLDIGIGPRPTATLAVAEGTTNSSPGRGPYSAHVLGPPVTMGSKRAFVIPGTNRAAIVDDKRPELRNWQEAMRQSMAEDAPGVLLCPFAVEIKVYLARPKGHFGSGRNAGKRKASAPKWPSTGLDVDKIARSVLDCGSGIWYRDDRQVFDLTVAKFYADGAPPCTVVKAWALEG